MPLFAGAGAKAMLAHMPRAKVRSLYERHADEAEVQAIGKGWDAFWSALKGIRQKGFYVSIGEVSKESLGIAAPIGLHDVGAVAALSLVLPIERLSGLDTESLGARVSACAWDISAQFQILTASGPDPLA